MLFEAITDSASLLPPGVRVSRKLEWKQRSRDLTLSVGIKATTVGMGVVMEVRRVATWRWCDREARVSLLGPGVFSGLNNHELGGFVPLTQH